MFARMITPVFDESVVTPSTHIPPPTPPPRRACPNETIPFVCNYFVSAKIHLLKHVKVTSNSSWAVFVCFQFRKNPKIAFLKSMRQFNIPSFELEKITQQQLFAVCLRIQFQVWPLFEMSMLKAASWKISVRCCSLLSGFSNTLRPFPEPTSTKEIVIFIERCEAKRILMWKVGVWVGVWSFVH